MAIGIVGDAAVRCALIDSFVINLLSISQPVTVTELKLLVAGQTLNSLSRLWA